MDVKIAPSILSADFGRLARGVRAAEEAGADWIHVDVMDGHFVPNLTIGPAVTAAVRRATRLPLDVHLMIETPESYLEAFADAGADRITVHEEACRHLHRTVTRIRELEVRPGVALNPSTPLSAVEEILPHLDLLLVMSVNPGFGGQRYIPTSTEKLRRARRLLDGCDRSGSDRSEAPELQVDGGVTEETAGEAAGAGASVLVAGSAVYGDPEGVAEGIRKLRRAASAPSANA